MFVKYFSILFIITGILVKSDGSRILGVFTSLSKSHIIVHMSIIESLVERGHDVTVITTIDVENNNNSFRHIQVKNTIQLPAALFDSMSQEKPSPITSLRTVQYMVHALAPVHNNSLNHPKVLDLMQKESFDLVILGSFYNDFQLGIAAHFKCPVVRSWMMRTLRHISRDIGQPYELFYVPTLYSRLHTPMSFMDRIKNVFYHLFELYMESIVNEEMEKYYQYNFPPDKYPTLDEMRKNISLVLTNHHFSEGPIFPMVPALIEIGGIQIKETPQSLPADIEQFLDDAKDGAIFFSFGSNFAISNLKPHVLQTIINVFSKLKQRVLMKCEIDSPPWNSSNILPKKWVPQGDILMHPNLRLFITHGGRGGIAETQYHGVPILGVPFFNDQMSNVDYAVKSGFGVRLDWTDLNENTFSNAIKEVLENPIYRKNIKRFSNVYRDRPMSPRQTAVYWVEYVIRHRGAKHMQSPAAHMNFFQSRGFDIIATLIVTGLLVFKLLLIFVARAKNLFIKIRGAKNKVE